MMTAKPLVGISRCLLGDEVRYDGSHKRNEAILDCLDGLVEWVPVCPEVEVGMGTPREPIHLVSSADATSRANGVRLLGVSSGEEWKDRMQTWANRRVQALRDLKLAGFVLKARSPSCGIHDVAISGGDGRAGRGVFASALIDALPELPVADEQRLADPRNCEEFLQRVRQYQERSG
jgi:uncharacterized protein YbbK (DUF523 family)